MLYCTLGSFFLLLCEYLLCSRHYSSYRGDNVPSCCTCPKGLLLVVDVAYTFSCYFVWCSFLILFLASFAATHITLSSRMDKTDTMTSWKKGSNWWRISGALDVIWCDRMFLYTVRILFAGRVLNLNVFLFGSLICCGVRCRLNDALFVKAKIERTDKVALWLGVCICPPDTSMLIWEHTGTSISLHWAFDNCFLIFFIA